MNTIPEILDRAYIKTLLKQRPVDADKTAFGHALIVAGSNGMAGASVLCAKACCRCGVGLLTVHAPACNRVILQTALPEAMCQADKESDCISEILCKANHSAVAIGPGIGTGEKTANALRNYLKKHKKPLLMDADALNIISKNKSLLEIIPENAVLTPHAREFERLFGGDTTSFERRKRASEMAAKYKIVIVLKGSKTLIAAPCGQSFLNVAANSGMASGGTGDVLAGMITSFLAQGYKALDAALLGVFLHSAAGQAALNSQSEESMTASDIVNNIGDAFKNLRQENF
jgi:NAD(P)H-hydrate epimerase